MDYELEEPEKHNKENSNTNEKVKNIKSKENRATYRIINLIYRSSFKESIPIKKIADIFVDAQLSAKQFPSVNLTLSKPKCTVILFKNGRIMIMGLKKINQENIVLEYIKERMKTIGLDLHITKPLELINIVVKINMHRRIVLEDIMMKLYNVIYEPEVFPGLILRFYEPKAVFLIFSTGNIILTGVKDPNLVGPLIKKVGRMLRENQLFK